MNRAFFTNLIFVIFINLLIKPFYIFGIDLSIQNAVGPVDYGLYLALLNFTFLFQIINDFGIQYFNNRNIAQHNQLFEKYFPNIIALKVGFGIFYTFFIVAMAYLIGYLPTHSSIFGFFVVNQILVSMILYLRSNVSALGYYVWDSIASVFERLLLIIICSVLLWANPWGLSFQIEWFIYTQTFTLSLTALAIFIFVYSRMKYVKWRIRWPFLLFLLKKSWPYALMAFLMTVYTRIDVVMIERLLPDGEYQSGVYGAAHRLLDALNMIGFLFAGLLLPMFSKLLKENRQEIPSLLRLSFQLMMAGAIPFSISVYFFQEEIIYFLYDDATSYWAVVLGFLIMSFWATCTNYTYGALLTANNSMYYMNMLFGIGFMANLVLNYFLILEYKALGATIASLITQFSMAIAQILLAKKIIGLSNDWRMIARISLYILLTIVLNVIFYTHGHTNWMVNFISTMALSILVALVLKLIDIKYLLKILAARE